MEVKIFGTSKCPNCVRVKQFLETHEIDYNYKMIGVDVTKGEVDLLVGEVVRSAPVILINGKLNTFPELKTMVQASVAAKMFLDLGL